MNTPHASRWQRQYLTGLTLIAIGAAFLLDQLGIVQVYDLWHYWPLALVVIGVVRMIDAPTARGVSSGLWTMFIGVWLYGNFEGWFGMDFSNSWPFLLIAWGVILVVVPITRKHLDTKSRNDGFDRQERHDAR